MKNGGIVQVGDEVKRHGGMVVEHVVRHFFKHGRRGKRRAEENGAIGADFALSAQQACAECGNQAQAAEAAGVRAALLLQGLFEDFVADGGFGIETRGGNDADVGIYDCHCHTIAVLLPPKPKWLARQKRPSEKRISRP